MKFNFEKSIKEKIKPYVLPALTTLSLLAFKDNNAENKFNTNNKQIEKIQDYPDFKSDTTDNEVFTGLIDNKNKEIKSINKIVPKTDFFESEQDNKLRKEITKLQEEIAEISDLKPVVKDDVFSIINQDDLSQKEIVTKRLDNGLEVNSPLDIRHITNMVEYHILNEIKNVNLASNELHAFKEQKLLKDEGYVNENKPSQYVIPEFYFVLDKNQTKDSMEIIVKIFSSKESKVVHQMSTTEALPDGDEFTDLNFNTLVQEKIVPNVINMIKEEINRKLNINKINP